MMKLLLCIMEKLFFIVLIFFSKYFFLKYVGFILNIKIFNKIFNFFQISTIITLNLILTSSLTLIILIDTVNLLLNE